MLKHYIEFFYPGSFFSESTVKEVPDRSDPVDIPKGVYGYCHFSREEVEQDGEVLKGGKKDYSPMTYFGEALTMEEVEALEPKGDYRTLLSNMRGNGWSRVVRTVRGNFQPLNEGDRVISL